MLQVRITTEAGRKLVLEFRPRDRQLGHRMAETLGGDGAPPTPPTTEVSATTT